MFCVVHSPHPSCHAGSTGTWAGTRLGMVPGSREQGLPKAAPQLTWRVTCEMPFSVPDRQVHFHVHVLKHQRFPTGSVETWCTHKYQLQGSAKNDSPIASFTRYLENFVLLAWNHIYSGKHFTSGSCKSWGIHRFLGSLDYKELFVQKCKIKPDFHSSQED